MFFYKYIILLYIIFLRGVLGTLGTLGTGVFPSRVRAGIFPCSQFIWKKKGVPSVPSVPSL